MQNIIDIYENLLWRIQLETGHLNLLPKDKEIEKRVSDRQDH